MIKIKKILVTGGTGFVGRQLIPFLQKKKYAIHIISTQAPQTTDSGIIWHQGDLYESHRTEEIVSRVMPTHLLHLAWYTEPAKYWTSAHNLKWVSASLSLIQSAVKHGVKRIVVAGSCAEYDWDYGFCSEKLTPYQPKTLYGVCKNSFRSIFESFTKQHGSTS